MSDMNGTPTDRIDNFVGDVHRVDVKREMLEELLAYGITTTESDDVTSGLLVLEADARPGRPIADADTMGEVLDMMAELNESGDYDLGLDDTTPAWTDREGHGD